MRNVCKHIVLFVCSFLLIFNISSYVQAYEQSVNSLLIWDGTVAEGFAAGTGTSGDPFVIETPEQFAYFALSVRRGSKYSMQYIKLNNDIYLNDISDWEDWDTTAPANVWTPAGTYYSPFYGTFDGGGHTVYGVYVNTESSYIGVFGVNSGVIKNLNVASSYIKGASSVGAIAGFNSYNGDFRGEIYNCKNSGKIVGSGSVGGIAGTSYHSVSSCENSGDVYATSTHVGGIVGNSNTVIVNCLNSGNILSDTGRAGGIAGTGGADNCCNTGKVTGGTYAGGIAGYSSRSITDCYNTGKVTGETNVGGMAGTTDRVFMRNCYNIGELTATAPDALIGAVSGDVSRYDRLENCYYSNSDLALSEQYGEFVDIDSMKSYASFDGFDFLNTWTIETKTGYDYPQLIINLPDSYGEDSAVWDGTVADSFAGGTGTEDDPYIITDASELAYLSRSVNDGTTYEGLYIKLTEDMVLNDVSAKYWKLNATVWDPIGKEYAISSDTISPKRFKGTFDGDNHTISGLYIDGVAQYQGLFGLNGGIVKNLHIKESFVKGGPSTGSIVGCNYGSVINCSSTATVWGTSGTGGIVGFNDGYYYDATIVSCYNMGTVYGLSQTGGICGRSRNSSTTDYIGFSYNSGRVYGHERVGGICGSNEALVQNCYNAAPVSGASAVGGICGANSSYCYIKNCYNIGFVSGTDYGIGGICGRNDGSVNCCYNTGITDGPESDDHGPITGGNDYVSSSCYFLKENINGSTSTSGTELTDNEMRTQASFSEFDFETVWIMPDGQYPELRGMPSAVCINLGTDMGTMEPMVGPDGDGYVMVAVYDEENNLVGLEKYTPKTGTFIDVPDGYVCKIMWWDFGEGLAPVCANRTLSQP